MNSPFSKLETGSIRSDKEIEAAVNQGLAISALKSVAEGATLMREAGVPVDVCARVLAHPEQRRASDWQHNAVILPALA